MGRATAASAMDEPCQAEQSTANPRRSLLRKWRDSIVFNKGDTLVFPAEGHSTGETETGLSPGVTLNVAPRMPPELCDRIIDHLYHDRDGLVACSLTCRAWLPASRLHLFRHVRLQSKTIPSFLSILTANPAIGPYVEDVMILAGSQGFTIPEIDQMRTLQSLKEILDRLPAVKILRIPVFFRISIIETVILAALSKSLQAIFFSGLFITDLRSLSDLLASFPHLQSVAFSNEVLWLPVIPLPPPKDGQITPTLPLRHLRISVPPKEHGAADFVKWLNWRFKLQELRSISIRYGELFRSRGMPSGVGQLFSKLGPSLEKLEIVMPRDVRLKAMHFDLSHCTKLKHISFPLPKKFKDLGVIRSGQYFFPAWAAIFLSRVKTDSVRSIAFTLNFQSNNDLRDLAYIEEIALPLSRPEFSHLTKVEFRIAGRFELQIRRFIKEELPELYARGIVSFV
ncbi:uncharacterized protein B0H18DRAFT_972329 [Fomitopsis serialis]|uniref:uncharacterized protein n=1 Tax=Fomitopsis serialis TaxID=139415 RepID=UPI002007B4A0|nr:uncharacterized protein B0H18DRAFT_972329 [Neoantrodia serialis]KAH9936125.1 hypothetical protein B0H18DRAFT_972329 [Neoantrodia serialis]